MKRPMKKCTQCHTMRPENEFYRENLRFRSNCRYCHQRNQRGKQGAIKANNEIKFDVLCDRMTASVLADCAAGLSLLERSRRDGLVG